MRLTKKREDGFYYDTDECMVSDCSNKLGQLEDIEEELGIDLVTLFKAASCGCYFKDDDENIIFAFASDIVIYYKYIIITHEKERYFKPCAKYGKTWALTKEELE